MTQAAFGGPVFNADVDLWLDCEYGRIRLRQAGADFVIADDSPAVPAGSVATLVISVNNQEHRRRVIMANGLGPGSPRSHVVSCDDHDLPLF